MGASRKLQGEIDRVLKKVQEGVDVFDSIWNKVYDTDNANQKEKFEADLKKEIKKLQRYRDQIKTWIQSSEIKDKKALMDARKLIEREMERFKICEKETKTKAFSKEGLGQQPKTDPKEKAKSETRDWLNNVVGELESQIDSFEAEMEGLSVKKGKTRPPRLTHLETSITRHKAHIMKLELILRLLDNDGLSPEQVNDVKDFLEDYVERNQEDFDEFSDVDELYSTLPLDKVETLEELVAIVPPSLVKGVGATSTALSMKTSATTTQTQLAAIVTSPVASAPEQAEEAPSQDSSSDILARTPPAKSSPVSSSTPSTPAGNHASIPGIMNAAAPSTIISSPSSVAAPLSPLNLTNAAKEEETTGFPGRKQSPSIAETASRGVSRGSLSNYPSVSIPPNIGSSNPSNGALGTTPSASETTKRNLLGADERVGSSGLVSPLSNRMMLGQTAKANDGTTLADGANSGEVGAVGGRVFSSPLASGIQWRPGSSFQNQSETGQFRGRTEIAPDQREKFLQRFQQVQQQGQSNILGMPLGGGTPKQFSAQQNPLLQQFNSQSSSITSQVGLGLGVQVPGQNTVASSSQLQPNSIHQQSAQHPFLSIGSKDEIGLTKNEELQQQQSLSDDLTKEPTSIAGLGKNLMSDDDLKSTFSLDAPGGVSLTEAAQVSRDIDLSPGQPLPSSQSSGSLGVIGRRSVAELGTIGDNLGGSSVSSGGIHDQLYNLQMLEAAHYKLPQPKDSERAKTYIPRHPAMTPPSYPQVQAPVINNPAFWERLGGSDNVSTDTLFFAFYYQPNTYQQYLAAKELKKQSWRYHRKYNTWFQRHEEPKVTTDEYEQGTYVYFDFHLDENQHGWCQRIKTEFSFEYNYLEDELMV